MPVKSRLTPEMLFGAALSVGKRDRTYKAVNAALWRMYHLKVGRTAYWKGMKDWGIAERVEEAARQGGQQAVANALAAEHLGELRSQVDGLNQVETIVGRLLKKAEATLEQVELLPSIENVGEVLGLAQNLMRTASDVRKDMADLTTGLAAEKLAAEPDNEETATPADDNVVDWEAAAERYKTKT